jgi:hypothetical protein
MKNPFGKTSQEIGKEKVEQAKKENKILELNKTILATLKKEEDRELFNEK